MKQLANRRIGRKNVEVVLFKVGPLRFEAVSLICSAIQGTLAHMRIRKALNEAVSPTNWDPNLEIPTSHLPAQLETQSCPDWQPELSTINSIFIELGPHLISHHSTDEVEDIGIAILILDVCTELIGVLPYVDGATTLRALTMVRVQ